MCVTHGKPCVQMHDNGEVYKRVGKLVHRGGEQQKGKEGKKKDETKKGREKERKRKSAFRQSELIDLDELDVGF